MNTKEIQDWLIAHVAELLHIAPDTIDIRDPFANYGLSSRDAVTLSVDLEELLGRRLSPTLAYEYPSILLLSQYLAEDTENKTRDAHSNSTPVNSKEPIDIIGIGSRFWRRTQFEVGKLHPLLGERMNLANSPSTSVWQTEIDPNVLRYLEDHQIQDVILLPASAYIEMALQAAHDTGIHHSHELCDFVFKKRMILQNGKPRLILAIMLPDQEDCFLFSIYSKMSPEDTWVLHAFVNFIKHQTAEVMEASMRTPPDVIRQKSTAQFTAETFYQILLERSLQYGPGFRGVEYAWQKDHESLGRIRLPESLQYDFDDYQIHPAFLDACLQVLAAAQDFSAENNLYIPTGCKRIRFFSRPGRLIWSHVILQSDALDGTGGIHADFRLVNEDNQIVAELIGLQLLRMRRRNIPPP